MAKVFSAVLVGVETQLIEVEAVVGQGFSGLQILGLPSDVGRDMKERVRSALESTGFPLPARRLVVSLSPANRLRQSRSPLTLLDFAVAASLMLALAESGDCNPLAWQKASLFLMGELRLSGELTGTTFGGSLRGCTPSDTLCCSAPMVINGPFTEFHHLTDWAAASPLFIPPTEPVPTPCEIPDTKMDPLGVLAPLRAAPQLATALLVAASARLHTLFLGEPGVGKSWGLGHFPALLPPLTPHEQDALMAIVGGLPLERPVRSPHHTCTAAALVGGHSLRPGEVTLAHTGVLILDELAEFPRHALESLREPLDSQRIEVSRASGSLTYPAHFLLMAASNPCPCGWFLSRKKSCRCSPSGVKKYLQKLSGPFLDRFPLCLWLENKHNSPLDLFSQNYVSCFDSSAERNELSSRFSELQTTSWGHNGQDLPRLALPMHLREEWGLSARGAHLLEILGGAFDFLWPKIKIIHGDEAFWHAVRPYRNHDVFQKIAKMAF